MKRGRGYTDHNFDFILLLWRIFKPRTIISLPLLFAPKYMNITPKFVITGNWCYIGNFWLKSGWNGFYLEHQQNRIQHDESHDEVLEGGRLDDPPEAVAHAHPLLRHVPLQRRRVDGKVDARLLQSESACKSSWNLRGTGIRKFFGEIALGMVWLGHSGNFYIVPLFSLTD